MKWLKRAACLGSDTEIFYLEDRSLEATKICSLCPVKSECFEYAVKYEDYGVWGGTTEEFRRAYRFAYGVELQSLDAKPPIPPHANCGTELGFQNLRQYWHRNKDKPRPRCGPCDTAHAVLIYN